MFEESINKAKVFLALDVNQKKEALDLVEKWSSYVQGFKVGPRLGFQLSKQEWLYFAKKGDLFLDYKFFDIPSTVKSSVERAFKLGSSFCTVHALNGEVCLKELSELEKKLNRIRPFKVLAVTLLTSFDQKTNRLPLVSRSSDSTVKTLTCLVVHSGLRGLVCSATEAQMIKSLYPKVTLVCPGVRLKGDSNDDQKRVLNPKEAFLKGADHLVMGRSLINVKNPDSVIQDMQ